MDPSLSYEMHSRSYEESSVNPENINYYRDFFNSKSIDVWRHRRMLSCIDPLLDFHPKKEWLAIGDGCYGTTSKYIEHKGSHALATDIDISALQVANLNGFLERYQYANAERLPFDDNSFDYAICKEAYHHFPRPHIAFYEMCRVSRDGLVLIEPSDWIPAPHLRSILASIKRGVAKLIGMNLPHTDHGCYEPIGNYVYTVSIREITKMSIALNYPVIAYKRFHDLWKPKYNLTKVYSLTFYCLKIKLLFRSFLKLLTLSSYNRLQVIVFKKIPDQELLKLLKDQSFNVEFLPRNPYI